MIKLISEELLQLAEIVADQIEERKKEDIERWAEKLSKDVLGVDNDF